MNITVDQEQIRIECTNTLPATVVTASIADYEEIAKHRWRWIADRCVTTIMEDCIEVVCPLPNLLLSLPRKAPVKYLNNDGHDCRRENIETPRPSTNPTPFTINGDVAYLHLGEGFSVVIDADKIPLVKPYKWSAVGKPRRFGAQLAIRTTVNGTTLTLQRLLLDLKTPKARFRHKDGNRLDCRMSNLEVVPANGTVKRMPQSVTVNVLTDPTSPSEVRKVYPGLLSPTGELYAPITRLRAFCDDHDLSYSGTVRALTGKASHHQGWTAYQPTYRHVE